MVLTTTWVIPVIFSFRWFVSVIGCPLLQLIRFTSQLSRKLGTLLCRYGIRVLATPFCSTSVAVLTLAATIIPSGETLRCLLHPNAFRSAPTPSLESHPMGSRWCFHSQPPLSPARLDVRCRFHLPDTDATSQRDRCPHPGFRGCRVPPEGFLSPG